MKKVKPVNLVSVSFNPVYPLDVPDDEPKYGSAGEECAVGGAQRKEDGEYSACN